MSKAVFMISRSSIYDDLPEVRYHFPNRRYLKIALKCVGDWILYYETKADNGSMCYVAVAQVNSIQQDPLDPSHSYAQIQGYTPFIRNVPFREGDFFYESKLKKDDGSINKGLMGWSLHEIPENEFNLIIKTGLSENSLIPEVADENFLLDQERSSVLIPQTVRDSSFSKIVKNAYSSTCAFTGLKISSGGYEPKYEVEAGHIKAVEYKGPDSPRNGISLSRSVHWMFDKGILSLEDDGKILKVDKLIPDQFKPLLNKDGYIIQPEDKLLKPHPYFLRFHRENRFIG